MPSDPTQSPFRPSQEVGRRVAHDFHQIIYTPVGHAVVWAGGHTHHLSGSVALFVPAGVVHAAGFDDECLVSPVGIDPEVWPVAGPTCIEVAVTSYRRRVLHRFLREQLDDAGDPRELCATLLGGPPALPLPEPRSEAARAVARGLVAGPASQRSVTEWAGIHYVSSTSLSRAFRVETGLTFSQWRTRARINASLDLLAEGQLISIVAQRVGFTSTNGYILAFRRHFGQTPKAFIENAAVA